MTRKKLKKLNIEELKNLYEIFTDCANKRIKHGFVYMAMPYLRDMEKIADEIRVREPDYFYSEPDYFMSL